jgi:hypothetical protein
VLRQLTHDEVQRLRVRIEVVGSLRREATQALEALGIRFHDRDNYGPIPPSAVVEAPSGEVFSLRWFKDEDEPWVWVIAVRDLQDTPEAAFERFMAAAALERSLVLAINDRWEPEEGRRTNTVRWDRVEVGDDGRTLTTCDAELLEGGPWGVSAVNVVEHEDAVELSFEVSNFVEQELPVSVRLEAPLGGRPLLDKQLGRLVRPEPPPDQVVAHAVPWESAHVPHPGVLVVRWHTGMANTFAGVDVVVSDAQASVAVRQWPRGGKLGSEHRVAVVQAPGVTAKTRLVDPAR